MISGNASNGILASSLASRINVDGCQLSFNAVAAINAAASGAVIRIANNAIYNNNAGVAITVGAVVETAGDNRISGNVSTSATNSTVVVQ